MKKFFKKIFSNFTMNQDFGLERYLSKSVDICDLEHRERKWSRMSDSERNFYGSK